MPDRVRLPAQSEVWFHYSYLYGYGLMRRPEYNFGLSFIPFGPRGCNQHGIRAPRNRFNASTSQLHWTSVVRLFRDKAMKRDPSKSRNAQNTLPGILADPMVLKNGSPVVVRTQAGNFIICAHIMPPTGRFYGPKSAPALFQMIREPHCPNAPQGDPA